MKKIAVFILVLIFSATAFSANYVVQPVAGGFLVPTKVINGDTVFLFELPPIYVFPPMKFKNKREEKFYWRTVRDVKKVLPYSKLISKLIHEMNDTLMRIPTEKERKAFLRQWEKTTYKKYYSQFTRMTLNQGKLLIRLVDRECQTSSYELIRAYRGRFTAGFYQMFAKLFGADLKSTFGTGKDDKTIERIIFLVEAGQL